MMTFRQYLLLKLAEECSEVAQCCSKQMQFGKDSTNRGKLLLTNGQKLREEVLDLFALVAMIQHQGEMEVITPEDAVAAYEAKEAKIQKYLKYSQNLGFVEPGWIS